MTLTQSQPRKTRNPKRNRPVLLVALGRNQRARQPRGRNPSWRRQLLPLLRQTPRQRLNPNLSLRLFSLPSLPSPLNQCNRPKLPPHTTKVHTLQLPVFTSCHNHPRVRPKPQSRNRRSRNEQVDKTSTLFARPSTTHLQRQHIVLPLALYLHVTPIAPAHRRPFQASSTRPPRTNMPTPRCNARPPATPLASPHRRRLRWPRRLHIHH